jgi:hypothetical protein
MPLGEYTIIMQKSALIDAPHRVNHRQIEGLRDTNLNHYGSHDEFMAPLDLVTKREQLLRRELDISRWLQHC